MIYTKRIGHIFMPTKKTLEPPATLTTIQDGVSIIDLVNSMVEYAYSARASDIHIEPETERVRVRLRIDGILHDMFILPKKIQQEVITRIKVLAALRTDEHQAAQDGRFKTPINGGHDIDIRVSIAPTYYGENAVLRLLTQSAKAYTLESLGFQGEDLAKIQRAIKKPYGMILATGPTGSGKTTTLYTLIGILNTKEVSIVTVEDPIEYSIEGIDQIQINPKTGITFAAGLRSILRQDPNIIMVGEIRDEETANIAVNAALTGHLLLSTLHTNDAATALPRLIDLNTEPFLISSTVNVIIGQRLVRKICEGCKTPKQITDAEFASLARTLTPKMLNNHRDFFVGKGCKTCSESGYKGRVGIYEVLEITDPIRTAIMKRANAGELRELAVKEGMTTMLQDGFHKAVSGVTTIEEILRVIHE